MEARDYIVQSYELTRVATDEFLSHMKWPGLTGAKDDVPRHSHKAGMVTEPC